MRDDRSSGYVAAPAVWLADSPDRKRIPSHSPLANFQGVLQRDAYVGFNAFYEGAQSRKLHAGRTHGEDSTICTRRGFSTDDRSGTQNRRNPCDRNGNSRQHAR